MSVKFFDAPISEDELGNLNEASAAAMLDAPTLTFKRQRVPTAPLPFVPAVAPRIEERAVGPTHAEPTTPRASRRTGQWLLAAAIVLGLGLTGHLVGAHARATRVGAALGTAQAMPQTISPALPQPTSLPAREIVATPVVRIAAAPRNANPEPQPVAKPKAREHARREAAPVEPETSTTETARVESTKTAPAKNEAAKNDTAKSDTAKTDGAEDDLMRQAAETLENAQLGSP